MTLSKATSEYLANKQSIGMVFKTEAAILRAFTKEVGSSTPVKKVTSDAVLRYLNGQGPVTRFWHRKHATLNGFWTFAIRRGYTDRSPVPVRIAKAPTPFVPYIYTREELRRLIDGMSTYQKKRNKLEHQTFRAIFLLLYGAGLRVSEALHLSCSDVDLMDAILTIRVSKFFKTRQVAINSQLCGVLADYDANRRQIGHPRDDRAPFFTYRDGGPIPRCVISDAFLRLRRHVGISRQNARHQPRLQDLRHSFAVHRVIEWYRSGADVQRLLPGLSTHLGHKDLASTQLYLTMTPELLAEASLKFEEYAGEVVHG